MKLKKLNLMNIEQDVLSREEMRGIIAGSGHCLAAFRTCVKKADNYSERANCRDGWCACIGCPSCQC